MDSFHIVAMIVSGGAWIGAYVAWRNARLTARSLAEAKAQERAAESYSIFIRLCSIPEKATGYEEARRLGASLFARLGGDALAAYIATTAYAWFCTRDSPPHTEPRRFICEAYTKVEQYLRDPSTRWTPPSADAIHDWGRTASVNNHDVPWLLK
jgi:hypothetical protein